MSIMLAVEVDETSAAFFYFLNLATTKVDSVQLTFFPRIGLG